MRTTTMDSDMDTSSNDSFLYHPLNHHVLDHADDDASDYADDDASDYAVDDFSQTAEICPKSSRFYCRAEHLTPASQERFPDQIYL